MAAMTSVNSSWLDRDATLIKSVISVMVDDRLDNTFFDHGDVWIDVTRAIFHFSPLLFEF